MGSLIKEIRESRSLKKIDVYEGIISKDLYNKIEENLSNAKMGDLILILDKLYISFLEFGYIINTYIPNVHSVLIKDMRTTFISSNASKLEGLISKFKTNPTTYYLLLSVKAITENKLDDAHKYARCVWEKLQEYDTYFKHDVYYLAQIFYLFPFKEGLNFIDILKKQLDYWREFDNLKVTEVSFYLNAGKYIEETEGKSAHALEYYYKGLELSKRNDFGRYTGIALLRIGSVENDQARIQEGKTVLEIFDPDILAIMLKDIGES